MKEGKNSLLTQFAKKLRLRRHELALTQEQLAEKAALSGSYIGELERGERNPALTTALALAYALNSPLEGLVEDKSEATEITLQHSEFLSFFEYLLKAMVKTSTIPHEKARNAVLSELSLLGLYYLNAHQSNNFKEFSHKMRVSYESLTERLEDLSDKKLAHRIFSSVYQLKLLLQD